MRNNLFPIFLQGFCKNIQEEFLFLETYEKSIIIHKEIKKIFC